MHCSVFIVALCISLCWLAIFLFFLYFVFGYGFSFVVYVLTVRVYGFLVRFMGKIF